MPWLIHAHPKLPDDLAPEDVESYLCDVPKGKDAAPISSGFYHHGIKIFAHYDDETKKDVGWVVREGAEMKLATLPDAMDYEIVEYDEDI